MKYFLIFLLAISIISCSKQQDEQLPQDESGLDTSITVDPAKSYTAEVMTNMGKIEIQLYPDKAPLAVKNFIVLAKGKFYDSLIFHRVIKDFVIQTGMETYDKKRKVYPFDFFKNEVSDLKHETGSVAMANAGPHTNNSQFYITMSPQPDLDGSYTVFGKVTNGFEVVKAINSLPVVNEHPTQQALITQVNIIEK